MTKRSVLGYADAVRDRHLRALRAERKMILDEFCKTTGLHRRSAIRLLHRIRPVACRRRGRRKVYGAEFVLALKAAWQATDCICSKRLAPFLAELAPIPECHGQLRVTETIRHQLMTGSASTIDRVLAPERLKPRHGLATTHSIRSFKSLIPVRTFAEKKGLAVGHVEVDLVAHCGATTEGFHLTSLVAVDVASSWTECLPVRGKGQSRVEAALVCSAPPGGL